MSKVTVSPRWRIIFCLIAILLPTDNSIAQTEDTVKVMQDIVITANKIDETYQTGDVDLEITPAFFSEIKREQFEGKIENIADILNKEVGVQVRKTGGLGSYSSISLRGSSSEQVMIFMDGILLNDSSYGGVDLSNIALSDIQSIEVYRGVTPLNFGKASIGGVVNIKTLRTKKGFKGSVGGGVGSFETKTANVFVNHKPGKWDYLVSGDVLYSKNDFWIRNDNGTDFNPYDDIWEKRNNNSFNQHAILTKAGYDVSDTVRLDFSNQWFDKHQELPTWNNSPDTQTTFDTKRNNTILKLTADHVGRFNICAHMDYSRKEEEYDDRQGDFGLGGNSDTGKQHNRYTTTSYGGHFFVEHITQWNILNIMLDARWEQYSPEDLLYTYRNPKDSSRDTYTAGIQDALFLFENNLSITPAVRYFHVVDKLLSGISSEDIILEGEEEERGYFNPQVGIKARAFSGLVFKLNMAKYTREPTFYELFGDRGYTVGNSDLVAEKGVNFDIGFLFSWRINSKYFNQISLNSAYFKSDVEDIITQTYNAQGFGKSVNVVGAEIKGVEAELKTDVLKQFRLIVNGTWQKPINLDKDRSFYKKILPGRFQESYLFRGEIRLGHYKTYGEWVYETGMFFDTANLLEANPKNELNVGISGMFHSFLLTVEGKNLQNNRYEAFNGFPQPGRSIYFTIKLKF